MILHRSDLEELHEEFDLRNDLDRDEIKCFNLISVVLPMMKNFQTNEEQDTFDKLPDDEVEFIKSFYL